MHVGCLPSFFRNDDDVTATLDVLIYAEDLELNRN